MTEWDVHVFTCKLGRRMLQTISQFLKSGCCYLLIIVDRVLVSRAITGYDSVFQFSGHGKKTAWAIYISNITLKAFLHQQRISSVTYTACLMLIHATKHRSSCFVSVVHKRDSATNLRCSKVSHHAFTLSSKCLHGTKHTRRTLIFLQ